MTWSPDFALKMGSQASSPVFLLHVLKWSGTPGRQFYACSSAGYGVPEVIGMEVSVSGSSISLGDWRYTHGTCSIQITAESISDLAYSAVRGSIAILKAGFPGYSVEQFEPVFMGRVENITGAGRDWVLSLWDGTSILQSRLAVGASSYVDGRDRVFYNVGSGDFKTTLTANYIVSSSSALTVSDSSIFEKLDGAGTTGAVVIDNGSDDPFYMTYTGISGSDLTGISTSDRFHTERKNSLAGSTVYNASYLEGPPKTIFLRMLLSGSGTSTLYDKYPDSWGWALPRDLVDVNDVENVTATLLGALSSGDYDLEYSHYVEVSDSWEWLLTFFSTMGLIPVLRQGLITLRPIQDPNDPLMGSEAHITDLDIEAVEEWAAYHPDIPAEYQRVTVYTNTHDPSVSATSYPTTFAPAQSLPLADKIGYLANDKVFQNQGQIGPEIKSRVGLWGPKLPELVTIRCAGLRLAGLAPTDVVHVTTSAIFGGRTNSTRDGYINQPCMVLSCSPSFRDGYTVLSLAAIDPL